MEKKNFSLGGLVKKSIKAFLIIIYLTFVIALSFGSTVAGVWTLLPAESFSWEVSKANHLGYYSVCSFSPYSTIILAGMAIIGFFLLVKLVKYFIRKLKNSVLYLKYKSMVKHN